MKRVYVATDRLREGFRAGHDPLRATLVSPDAGSRPNCAPGYYQGRPASVWIDAMKPRRGRKRQDNARPASRPGPYLSTETIWPSFSLPLLPAILWLTAGG